MGPYEKNEAKLGMRSRMRDMGENKLDDQILFATKSDFEKNNTQQKFDERVHTIGYFVAAYLIAWWGTQFSYNFIYQFLRDIGLGKGISIVIIFHILICTFMSLWNCGLYKTNLLRMVMYNRRWSLFWVSIMGLSMSMWSVIVSYQSNGYLFGLFLILFSFAVWVFVVKLIRLLHLNGEDDLFDVNGEGDA